MSMRTSVASLALIERAGDNGVTLYLTQWNPKWQALNFVGGHRRPDESFRQCLARELKEELGIDDADFSLTAPPTRLEYVAWSESAKADTAYVMEIFPVALSEPAINLVSANDGNEWLTDEEIQAGQSRAGRAISPTIALLLRKLRIPSEADGSQAMPLDSPSRVA